MSTEALTGAAGIASNSIAPVIGPLAIGALGKLIAGKPKVVDPNAQMATINGKVREEYINSNYPFEGVTRTQMFEYGGIANYGTPLQKGDKALNKGRGLKLYKGGKNQSHRGYGLESMSGIPIPAGEVESGETIYGDKFIFSDADALSLGVFADEFDVDPDATPAEASLKIAEMEANANKGLGDSADYAVDNTKRLNEQYYDDKYNKLFEIQGMNAMRKGKKFKLGNNFGIEEFNDAIPHMTTYFPEFPYTENPTGAEPKATDTKMQDFMRALEGDLGLDLQSSPDFRMSNDPQLDLPNNGNSIFDEGNNEALDALGGAVDLFASNADILGNFLTRNKFQSPQMSTPLSEFTPNTIDINTGVEPIRQDANRALSNIQDNAISGVGANAAAIKLFQDKTNAENRVRANNIGVNQQAENMADRINFGVSRVNRDFEQTFKDNVTSFNNELVERGNFLPEFADRYNTQKSARAENLTALLTARPEARQYLMDNLENLDPATIRAMGLGGLKRNMRRKKK